MPSVSHACLTSISVVGQIDSRLDDTLDVVVHSPVLAPWREARGPDGPLVRESALAFRSTSIQAQLSAESSTDQWCTKSSAAVALVGATWWWRATRHRRDSCAHSTTAPPRSKASPILDARSPWPMWPWSVRSRCMAWRGSRPKLRLSTCCVFARFFGAGCSHPAGPVASRNCRCPSRRQVRTRSRRGGRVGARAPRTVRVGPMANRSRPHWRRCRHFDG